MDMFRKLIVPTWRPTLCATRNFCCPDQVSKLVGFPEIKMGVGKLKYILAKVYIHGEEAHAKTVIRAVGSAKYHLKIYDALRKEAATKNLCTQCLGGGTIDHNLEKRFIKISGHSQTLGRADHEETKSILSDKYSDYKIHSESAPSD
ncbi:sex-regulated protein janus-B [Drosophila sulfurigaster albostrigata]|uniref:sex-regulated protein janus-B n=1 Tax=Drosophila sulfurigaster albostrigata TaxID=89887 RepID=UPI002D21C618|nr:sex-regulated protein janus-B [Drosophila sulfurigaster albostrigata]XP_062127090.1 sex-regulated protein janus-B [Drosophila sulfurigaster albostrigata]XP_062127099.1 sex-regulated protein janus-B [Drosophila sulfurigaster albostrigata]XP_062127107.1 sex-regulated protein janus-B [Drosophila sulfurigaster albostrigata]